MKNLSLVKDEDINNFYKLVSQNVKRIKIAVTLVVIVGFATYYFYPKDDYVMEMVKPTRPPV